MDGVDVRVSARPGRGRCAYCHDDLRGGAEEGARPCGGCGTSYHADCLAELGGCSTPGCTRPAAPKLRLRGGGPRRRPPVFGRVQPGQSRTCTACEERFVVTEASPYNPVCPPCTRRRTFQVLLAVFGATLAYILLVVITNA